MPDSFLQKVSSGIREEVLAEMLQEELPDVELPYEELPDEDNLPDEDELPNDMQDETPTYDIEDLVASDKDNPSTGKRVRFQVSEDENEQDHPAKRVRLQARDGIKKQAARMVARSSQSLKNISPGDNVAVPISQFDRSFGDLPNVIGVVLSIHEKELYTIGTKSGKIKGKLFRSQFKPIDYKGLEDNHVPPNIELTLREIVRTQSVCKGQGFTKCNCKGTCLRNCSCYKKKLNCNSACHTKTVNRNCKNVDGNSHC